MGFPLLAWRPRAGGRRDFYRAQYGWRAIFINAIARDGVLAAARMWFWPSRRRSRREGHCLGDDPNPDRQASRFVSCFPSFHRAKPLLQGAEGGDAADGRLRIFSPSMNLRLGRGDKPM
jgi:hypothetical protein